MKPPAILERLRGVQRAGDGWLAFCPAHNDQHRRSLSIGLSNDGRTLLNCHAVKCPVEKIVGAVQMTLADLAPPATRANGHRPPRQEVAAYDYRDERGGLLSQNVRFEPKDFLQRRPDGHGGWIWDMKGVRRVPYRLPDLAEQPRVFIAEGEKDCDALWALGLAATTNAAGAGKWTEEHTAALVAAAVPEVIVLPDNDAPGEKHARAVGASCHAAGLRVKTIRLPGLPPKGDVSDWLAAGHTAAELTELGEDAPAFVPDHATPTETSGPRVTLTPEDGALIWPDGAGISFARVTEGSRGVTAEVTVTWQGRELEHGQLNLLSTRSRDQFVTKPVRIYSDIPWQTYLDSACRQMVARRREGEPVERLEARPRPLEQYLVRPVLAAGETTVTFGPGGSGKSLYALALEVAVTTGCALPGGLRALRVCPVLVLDWESSKIAHEARLYELCRALEITPPTTLYYKRMTGPLSDSIRQIRADVARLGVGLVRVDSLALAAGREPEGADAATRTMNDLRTLGDHVTRHIIAHVAKSGLDIQGAGHVYGSIFNENVPRNTYEVRAAADAPEDELVQAIFHRKANESRKHPPFGLRFILSPEDLPPADKIIRIEACGLREAPDLLARAPLSQQLRAALSNGAKTIPGLAVELDAKEDTINKTLRRHPKLFIQLPGDKPPFQWGLVKK